MPKLSKYQVSEFKKCKEDPIYFIRTYLKLRHPKKGAIPFAMYGWQEKLVTLLVAGMNVSLIKSRQVGASWGVGGYIIWLLIFFANQEIQIFSVGERQAISLLRKIKFMYRSLPPWLRHTVAENNQKRMALVVRKLDETTGKETIISYSSVDAFPSSVDSGKGETPNFVFFDEHAAQQNDKDVWGSVQPALLHGGHCVSCSTPTDYATVFADVYDKASSGLLEHWEAMRVHYTDCGYDEGWIAKQSVGMTPMQIRQYYELEFTSGTNPVFDPAQLAAVYKPINHPKGMSGLRYEWTKLARYAGVNDYTKEQFEVDYADLMAKMEATKECYTGVDSSEGKGLDQNSICTVNEYGIQIACDHNNLPLPKWAGVVEADGSHTPGFVTQWHKKYGGEMVIEENGPGIMVYNMHKPYDEGYTVHVKRAVDNQFHTGLRTRIINNLVIAVAGKRITITDPVTYDQLRAFQFEERTGKMTAPKGKLDDAVLSLAWAYYCLLLRGIAMYEGRGATTTGNRIFNGSVWEVGGLLDNDIAVRGPVVGLDDDSFVFDLDRIRSLR